MNKHKFIQKLIDELSYRVPEGMPILSNPRHIKVLSEILDEWGLYSIKNELIRNLTTEDLTSEAEGDSDNEDDDDRYETPVLNKEIEYENSKGETETGKVGDLLRTPEGSDSREQAEKHVPEKGTPERDKIDDDLGDEGKPSDGETKEKENGESEDEGNDEEGYNVNDRDGGTEGEEEVEPEKGTSITKNKDTLSRYEKERQAAKEDEVGKDIEVDSDDKKDESS